MELVLRDAALVGGAIAPVGSQGLAHNAERD